MTDQPRKVYWDACVWISLIMGETSRIHNCVFIIDEAKKGRIEIWTSSLTHAEAFKMKCGQDQKGIQADKDKAFEDYLEQEFVVEVAVDHDIGVLARTLLRKHCPPLKKPNDAIHLATAILHNVDELHTSDRDDLLNLDGHIQRKDGKTLKICNVPNPPPVSQQHDLLTELTQTDETSQEKQS